jgi:4-hydroxy 2-oxovalerate aldolase
MAFNDDFVRKVFIALSQSGVDYMEIGGNLRNIFPGTTTAHGSSVQDDLKRVCGGIEKTLKLSAMADIGRIDDQDIPKKSESALDMIRVACYAKEVDKAISLAHHCMDKGYEVTINLMAVSKVLEKELDDALEDLAKSYVPVIYLVDSFGAMYRNRSNSSRKIQVRFRARARHPPTIISSCLLEHHRCHCCGRQPTRLDHLRNGRGAGNCPTELLFVPENPKFDIRPIIRSFRDLYSHEGEG